MNNTKTLNFEDFLNEAKTTDTIDVITMNVPLFIRLLEYSKEDAETDMDLHVMAEKALSLSKKKTLTMDNYDELIGVEKKEDDDDDDDEKKHKKDKKDKKHKKDKKDKKDSDDDDDKEDDKEDKE